MIELVLGLVLIIALYARTFQYRRLIDDAVPMSEYLYNVPKSTPAPSFFLERTPSWHRVLAIGCHLFNTWLVYLLLGGKAALLFAVFPVSVNNVAWITGSYYACTTMLTLIAFYFITHLTWFIGIPTAVIVYAVALNTTICTIGFPFVFLFGNPLGLVTGLALLGFFTGRRWTVGRRIREEGFDRAKMHPDRYSWGRFAFSIKLLALYLYTAVVPTKLLFFRRFGARYRVDEKERKSMDAFNGLFWMSLALLLTFIVLGFVTGKLFWAMWFLILLAPFCQIKMLGQVFAERYMYPAVVGLCALLAQLPEPVFWALVGFYAYRAHLFIPVFETNKALFENGAAQEDEPANFCNLFDWYFLIQRDLTLAGWYIQKAIEIDPLDYKHQSNMASFWRTIGQYANAKKHNDKAKELAEGLASPHIHGILDRQAAWIAEELRTGKPAVVNVNKEK